MAINVDLREEMDVSLIVLKDFVSTLDNSALPQGAYRDELRIKEFIIESSLPRRGFLAS
jgi:hypothetical protein